MANTKLTSLVGLTTPAADDSLYIVDASDLTDSPQGTSKKISFSNLTATFPTVPVSVANGGTGLITLTAGSVLVGNGTSAVTLVATTGSGSFVRATSPVLTTPSLDIATATSINKVVFTTPATVATLTIANAQTLTVSGSTTLLNGTQSGTNTGDQLNNFSTEAQTPAAATRTYITGSQIAVPVGKLRIGTVFKWIFDLTKTAAGVAASTFDIAIGTAGTTADPAILSFTKPAGTAVVDNGRIIIQAIVRGPLSAAGIIAGNFVMTHNLQATGHINNLAGVSVTTISGAFDVTTAGLFVGLCITSGAADAVTIQLVTTETINL